MHVTDVTAAAIGIDENFSNVISPNNSEETFYDFTDMQLCARIELVTN